MTTVVPFLERKVPAPTTGMLPFLHSMTGCKQLPGSAARTGGDLLSEIFSIRDCDVLSPLHSSEKQGLIIKYLGK